MGNVGIVDFEGLAVAWFWIWTPMTRMLSFMSYLMKALSTLHGVVGGKGGQILTPEAQKMEVKNMSIYRRDSEEKVALIGSVNERLNTGIDPVRPMHNNLIVVGGVYLRESYGIQDRYTVNRIDYHAKSQRLYATFKVETRGEGHPQWRTRFKAMKRPITSTHRDSKQMIDDDEECFTGSDYLCMAWEVMAEPKPYEVNYLHADHFGEDDTYSIENTSWDAKKEYLTKADAEVLLDRLENPNNYTHLAWVEDRLIESVHRHEYEERDAHWFSNTMSDECLYYNGQGIQPHNLHHTFQIGKEYACGNDTITINAVRLKRANLTHEVAFSINNDEVVVQAEIDYVPAVGSDQRSLTESFTLYVGVGIDSQQVQVEAGCKGDERTHAYSPSSLMAAERGSDYRYQASTEWREVDLDAFLNGDVEVAE